MLKRVVVIWLLCISLIANDKNSTIAWFEDGKISPNLFALVQTIKNDDTILCKNYFDFTTIDNLIEGYRYTHDEEVKRKLQEFADKLLFIYVNVKNNGCYDPSIFLHENFLPPKKRLQTTLHNPIIQGLYEALRKYKRLQDWHTIVTKDYVYLKKGKKYDEVPALKKRLHSEGYYMYEDFNDSYFDEKLEFAVKEFQKHHGLKVDGVVGPMTLEVMNIPRKEKIERILINIERARWFLDDDRFFIFVDIPGYFLQIYDGNETIFSSKVVVGRKSRPTPQMRNTISYAILNPYWRAPKTIVKEDIWPHLLQRDFETLKQQGIVAAIDRDGEEVVDFEDINWSCFTPEDVPFIFLQKPGPKNFLGFIKFMFPNRFDVYLHDTNHPQLFKYPYRALSSGCVRVQKPIELYYILKKRYEDIVYRDIVAALWDGKKKRYSFKKKIPIYLLYLTVYNKNGEIYFYPDIYGIDKSMLQKRGLFHD